MRNSLVSLLVYLSGNAIGLLLASLILPGFRISFTAFVVAVVLFSTLLVILKPLILKLTQKNIPAIEGGIALVTTFAGLFLTSVFVHDMHIGGISNWLLATLLVWFAALLSGIVLNHWFRPTTSKND